MLGFNQGRGHISSEEVRRALNNPKTDVVLYSKAVKIRDRAILIFQSREKSSNESTFPLYAASFSIRKVRRAAGEFWQVVNNDPAAFWVEFGAYYKPETKVRWPNHPMILRYAPLRLATDAVSAEE
jgi:hypothetical protein